MTREETKKGAEEEKITPPNGKKKTSIINGGLDK
jgi:hypothetical protein